MTVRRGRRRRWTRHARRRPVVDDGAVSTVRTVVAGHCCREIALGVSARAFLAGSQELEEVEPGLYVHRDVAPRSDHKTLQHANQIRNISQTSNRIMKLALVISAVIAALSSDLGAFAEVSSSSIAGKSPTSCQVKRSWTKETSSHS